MIDKCTDRDARPYVIFSPMSVLVFIFLTFLFDNNVYVLGAASHRRAVDVG